MFNFKSKPVEAIRNGNVNINTGNPIIAKEFIPPPSPVLPKDFCIGDPKLTKSVEAILDKREQKAKPMVHLKHVGMAPEKIWLINDILSNYVDANYADYHKDWNKLMEEVVEKIERTHVVHISGNECSIENTGYSVSTLVMITANTKHQAVLIACYEFVRLFNSGADLESRK